MMGVVGGVSGGSSLALMILASLIASAASANFPWAKPNCSETCGNVTIPYPFGIGDPHCYLNTWFEITCNTSSASATHSRPFLSVFNLEVLNITLQWDSWRPAVLVNSPVYSTCKDGSSWNSSDLSGSPFAFSYSNRFVTVGCDNTLLKNRENEVLAGCTSTCRGESPSSSGCYGINCCQTTIPFSLTFYALTSTPNTSACTYSFLASREWFQTNFSSDLLGIENKDHVPVSLRWGIQSGNYRSRAYYCGEFYSYTDEVSLGLCRCSDTYEGNPYIPNGCRVVSACSKCNGRCERDVFTRKFYCRRNRTTEIIIAGTVGGGGLMVILFIFCFGMYKLIKRRRELKMKKKFFKRNGGLLLQQQLSLNDDSFDTTKIFTAKELEKATDSFNISRVLGQGGQGTVYKGMLTDGKIVAVKKSRLVDEGQVEQFINEVVILSQINHRNIVKLLGCCLETEVPLLVYEFISNGALSQLIRNQDDEFPLSWEMRLQIAAQVSGALAYLHSATSVPIYHRDVKSSNILLDDKYRAKVADFGTSRSVSIDQTHLTTIVQGTFGYLDPEFFQSSQFTDKSDVYSFGVVLAELLTGERPIMSRAGQEEKNLAAYFISYLEEDSLFDIIDQRVAREGSRDEIIGLAALARRCLNLNGKLRPAMKQVMFEIEQIRTSHMPSTVPQEFRHMKEEASLSPTSFSDYIGSPSDDSHHLLFNKKSTKSFGQHSFVHSYIHFQGETQ